MFYNWPCNSIFELQKTLVTQMLYLYAMNVNRQVAWVAIHHIYNATHCNLIATLLKQLIFNYYATPLFTPMMSC